MVDCSNYIITGLKNAVTSAKVSSAYGKDPAEFPALTVGMIGNYVVDNARTVGNLEHLTHITFELNVYTNNAKSKEKKAFTIANLADAYMSSMNFTRDFMSPTPNIADATIFRITMRYSAIVSYDATETEFTFYHA